MLSHGNVDNQGPLEITSFSFPNYRVATEAETEDDLFKVVDQETEIVGNLLCMSVDQG